MALKAMNKSQTALFKAILSTDQETQGLILSTKWLTNQYNRSIAENETKYMVNSDVYQSTIRQTPGLVGFRTRHKHL